MGKNIANTSKATISSPGDYTVLVTNDNLCEILTSFTVVMDSSELIVSNIPDSLLLTCQDTFFQLQVEATTNNIASSYWLNNNRDTISNIADIELSRPGTYIAGIIGPSGLC